MRASSQAVNRSLMLRDEPDETEGKTKEGQRPRTFSFGNRWLVVAESLTLPCTALPLIRTI